MKLQLRTVTLFGIDAHDPEGLAKSASICMGYTDFGSVKMITDRLFYGREGYSEFCIKHMARYIDTAHVLIIHPDSWIVRPEAWTDEFLQYDYVGATWWHKDNLNVGNGGFTLRSKKLLDILATLDINCHPEDVVICRDLRPWLEREHGIKFAPEELANRFAIEAGGVIDKRYNGAFGYHGHNVNFEGWDIEHKPKYSLMTQAKRMIQGSKIYRMVTTQLMRLTKRPEIKLS